MSTQISPIHITEKRNLKKSVIRDVLLLILFELKLLDRATRQPNVKAERRGF